MPVLFKMRRNHLQNGAAAKGVRDVSLTKLIKISTNISSRRYKSNHATSFEYGDYTHASQIIVNFMSREFYPFILTQQFTMLDFVSYTGGALGLFLGFSVLSFIEIIYYFSLRLALDAKSRIRVAGLTQIAKGKRSFVSQYLHDFLEKSSIHGMNQIVMKNRYSIERFESTHNDSLL